MNDTPQKIFDLRQKYLAVNRVDPGDIFKSPNSSFKNLKI